MIDQIGPLRLQRRVDAGRSSAASARRCSCGRLPDRRTGRASCRSSATYAFSVIRYAGSFVLRRIGIAPVTCRWMQAERAAEQVDAGGDERRPDAVVVEHERLDEVVGVALVVRRVDDAVRRASRP